MASGAGRAATAVQGSGRWGTGGQQARNRHTGRGGRSCRQAGRAASTSLTAVATELGRSKLGGAEPRQAARERVAIHLPPTDSDSAGSGCPQCRAGWSAPCGLRIPTPHCPRRTRERADLFQVGCLALVRAAARYRAEHDGPFAPFALLRIRGAVFSAIHEYFATIRVPTRRLSSSEKSSPGTGRCPGRRVPWPANSGTCSNRHTPSSHPPEQDFANEPTIRDQVEPASSEPSFIAWPNYTTASGHDETRPTR